MRLASYFLLLGAFAGLSFVSGLRNVTLDDNDPAIIYSPGWNVSRPVNSMDFGGSLHFSDNSTVSASLTFRGVAVYLMAPLWSSRVGIQVTIDGQDPFTIDLEDHGVPLEPDSRRETQKSQVVWASSKLSNTEHTIVISMPPATEFVVLDGLIYSIVEANNAAFGPAPKTSTSLRFTTSTTTALSTFSSSAQSSTFVRPTTKSSSSLFPTTTTFSSSPIKTTSSITSKPTSSSPSSSSNLLTSTSAGIVFPNLPINVASAPYSTTASVFTVSVSPTSVRAVSAASTNLKRTVIIGSIFGAVMLVLATLALLGCLRRRRIRQRRQQTYAWSRKLTPYPPAPAVRAASRPLPPRSTPPRSPYKYEHSPASAVPLLPQTAPPARRTARSPLATAAPIMPPSPSPQTAQFPPFLAANTTEPSSPIPATPLPMTPLPATPLPPATPGTPWSTQKSNRFSGSSTFSYSSSSVESGIGYGWTTPSLVGIHPFSASADPEPSASGSGSAASTRRGASATVPLTPKLNEKSAAALFRSAEAEPKRISAAPAYQEKDARRLFAEGRARAMSQASSLTAPPVYEP